MWSRYEYECSCGKVETSRWLWRVKNKLAKHVYYRHNPHMKPFQWTAPPGFLFGEEQ